MGIEHKHTYRFGYLRSEKWQTLRIAALAEKDAKCKICGERSLSNDIHHVYYPPSFWDTKVEDVVILCRRCHEFVHSITDLVEGKDTNNKGRCFARFRMICESFASWMIAGKELRAIHKSNKERSEPKSSKETDPNSPKPCMRCKSNDNLSLIEVCPKKPTETSKWVFCGKCSQLYDELKIEGFKGARDFVFDFRKNTCK